MDEVQVEHPRPGSVAQTTDLTEATETAGRQRPAVSLYVVAVSIAAVACFTWVTIAEGVSLSWALVAFAILAGLADLREIRLPRVGHVGMSFVPVLAALAVLGLWPALVVAIVSGATAISVTKDPQKITFDIANYVVSTFLAGIVYLAVVPAHPSFVQIVLPAFLATGVDFFANTLVLSGVIGLSAGENALGVWRKNYQWALPGYLTGTTFALLTVALYDWIGIPGLVLAVPPVVLIYYSYGIYVSRARERQTFDAERDSFQEELATSIALHDELRDAQLKVAAEIERARRIQTDLLPTETPAVAGLELARRIEFLGEMGGDYYDYIPVGDGRLAIVCGDVMGKGLAAALIMAMARSLLHNALGPDKTPGAIMAEVNDGLARDLEGQRLPYFLTLALLVYDPERRTLVVAGGGHNPVLVGDDAGIRKVPSRGAALGVRTGLQFPEDELTLGSGATLALYTDGLTEARGPDGELFGLERLEQSLERCRTLPIGETLDGIWGDVGAFRGDGPRGDDATLLLARLT